MSADAVASSDTDAVTGNESGDKKPSEREDGATTESQTSANDAKASKEEGGLPRRKPRSIREAMMGRRLKLPTPPFVHCRFFIPEELAIRADLRFKERGSSWGFLALSIVLIIVFFFAALGAAHAENQSV